MRRSITFLLLFLACILVSSCTNLDDIYKRLDDHEKRISAMEEMVKTANENITSIQALLDAIQNKVTINSFKELPDQTGYELTMSDGRTIVLKNGKDGQTPVINAAKDTDGVYYWTLNGEFITDANGNKIKAEGADGTPGVTPMLRVNTDGFWEVSMDQGKTWTAILGADGKPVKAVGSDAEVDLTITEDENNITIVYDGKTFVISKNSNAGTDPEQDVRLPIDYMSEFNVAPDGKTFVTTNKIEGSGFFTFEEAVSYFSAISIDGKDYHLPNLEEWRGIINDTKVSFRDRSSYDDVEELIQMGKEGEQKTYLSDYRSPEDYTAYGLRFKGTDLMSAWRYQCVDDPDFNDGKHKLVVVSVRALGESFTGTVEDISKKDYWENDDSKDIVRYIPLCGYIDSSEEVQGLGSDARYFSSTATGSYCWYAFFTSYSLGLMDTMYDWYYMPSDKYTVRLFED